MSRNDRIAKETQSGDLSHFSEERDISPREVGKDAAGYRILVVDDEKGIRDFLFIALSMVDQFSVEVAGGGVEALHRVEEEKFDLVLTDLKMPDMDGLQLITEIVKSKPEILTVIMTGYGTIESTLEAMKRGASDYLLKPLDVHEVIDRLQRVLAERNRFVKLRDLAAQLESVNKELKMLDEMKSEFVSLASHELKTPLTAVKSAIQLMLVEKIGKVNRTQKKFLAISEANINRLTKLIGDLLDLCQIRSGRMEIKFEEFDLSDVIEFMIACLTPRAEGKSIKLKSDVAKNLPAAYGDREKVEKILLHLIENSIKFTPEGGKVLVSVKVSERENDAIISIRDSGIGIPKDQLTEIFKAFSHGEEPFHQSLGGSRLGLAVTKGLVEAQKGRIRVESEVGKGSILTFTLPLSRSYAMSEIPNPLHLHSLAWKS